MVGAALFLGLLFAVKGCLDARKERAFKDYARDVAALMEESRQQSGGFFTLLRQPGRQSPVDLQNSVNGFRVQAEQLVERAREADRPDELAGAQGYLVEALEFRRDGLAGISGELLTALGDQGRQEAAARIARDMQAFLASDALYERRVVPALRRPLAEEGLLGEVDIPSSRFLTDLEWLQPSSVSERLARIRGGGGGEAASPGPHGTGLGTVTVGGQALTAGATARIPAGPRLAVAVQVQNQGASAERDVTVEVSITGGAGRPIEVRRTIEELAAGASTTVTVPLTASPPTGQPVTVKVAVVPVPGEKKVDNNRGTFPAVFGG